MGIGLAIFVLIAVAITGALRYKGAAPTVITGVGAFVAVCACAAVVTSLIDVTPEISPTVAALAAISATIGLLTPARPLLGDTTSWASTGVALGVGVGALLAAQLGAGQAEWVSTNDGALLLMSVAVGVLAIGLGFVTRALERAGGLGYSLFFVGLGALAFHIMAIYGGDGFVAHVPLASATGPAQIIAGGNQAIVATVVQPELSGMLMAAAAVALVGGVWPQRKLANVMILGGGVLFATVLVWLLTLDGVEAQIDTDMARNLLLGLDAPKTMIDNPRLLVPGPYTIDLSQLIPPLTLLAAAALGSIGLAVDRMGEATVEETNAGESNTGAPVLAARDAFQVGTVCTCLALGVMLVYVHHNVGVWGAIDSPEHLLSGTAFATVAATCALHAIGGERGGWRRVVRGIALAAGAVLIAGTLAGGLVGQLGITGL